MTVYCGKWPHCRCRIRCKRYDKRTLRDIKLMLDVLYIRVVRRGRL